MVGALVLYGVKARPAAAATLVYHAISLWIPAVWGTLAFVLLRRHRRRAARAAAARGAGSARLRLSGSASRRSPGR